MNSEWHFMILHQLSTLKKVVNKVSIHIINHFKFMMEKAVNATGIMVLMQTTQRLTVL